MPSTLTQVCFRSWGRVYIGVLGGFLLLMGAELAQAQTACPPRSNTLATPPCEPQDLIDRANKGLRTPLLDVDRWLNRQLVGTTPKGKFRLALAPSFVNVTDTSQIALNFRLYYGITAKWMAGFRLRTYADNPFSKHERNESGIGDIILETKYRLPSWRAQHVEAAIGLKVLLPLTQDENRSDGVIHIVPGITLIRPIFQWAPVHLYTRMGIDFATEDIVRTPVADEIQETFFLWAWGLVHPAPSVLVFFDVEWQTDAFIDGGQRHNILVTPGVRYELPKLRGIPGLLTVEVGVRIGFVDADNLYNLGFRLIINLPKRKSPPTRASSHRANLASQLGALMPAWPQPSPVGRVPLRS